MARKHELEQDLKKALEKDIIEGNGTLTEIAERHNTDYGKANSVLYMLRVFGVVEKVGVKANGDYFTKDKVSNTVESYNIKDLSDEKLRKKGLERFIKK
jgi:predicted transcriptional regulator